MVCCKKRAPQGRVFALSAYTCLQPDKQSDATLDIRVVKCFMLGFIDESGDTGFRFERGSSGCFVITMVLFQGEEEVDRVSNRIEALKASIRPNMEFHFAKTEEPHRQKFFEAVREFDFGVFALVVNKTQLNPFKHDEFILTSFKVAMEEAQKRGLLDKANVKFDETGGNAFQKKLASALLYHINGNERGKYIQQFIPERSTGSNLIQLADMVCGAVARPHNSPNRKEHKHLKLLKHQINDDSVLEWP
jgi:hypothetical protein